MVLVAVNTIGSNGTASAPGPPPSWIVALQVNVSVAFCSADLRVDALDVIAARLRPGRIHRLRVRMTRPAAALATTQIPPVGRVGRDRPRHRHRHLQRRLMLNRRRIHHRQVHQRATTRRLHRHPRPTHRLDQLLPHRRHHRRHRHRPPPIHTHRLTHRQQGTLRHATVSLARPQRLPPRRLQRLPVRALQIRTRDGQLAQRVPAPTGIRRAHRLQDGRRYRLPVGSSEAVILVPSLNVFESGSYFHPSSPHVEAWAS